MTKKQKKERSSVQVWMNNSDRLLFLQHCVDLEAAGISKTKSEVASDLFTIGLHNEFETIEP